MATTAHPEGSGMRPNIPSAAVRFPAVKTYEQVDREIIATLRPSFAWFVALGLSMLALLVGALTWTYQIREGLGAAGYHPPVMWGVYIITFVFWVGIGHAGTLISAILYLFRAGFRTSIYRVSEAMTVFAVMTAGLFPILHLGRPWKFFWLIAYPNWRLVWPNPKSPLVWDVFAILTYLTISSTFLYVGLIPDLAVLRDRETNPIRKRIFAALALGWRNSDNEWRHFTRAYLFLAAFATPLVLSVHSVVSFDFAMALTPGWHATIFPPYFVAGAIFSGIGMVFTIIIPLRKYFKLQHFVTIKPVASNTLAMLSRWRSVMKSCSPYAARIGKPRVSTIAKPAKIAPATKYGGKIVACHPGTCETAKSSDTIECTLTTSGVASPASSRYAIWYRFQCRADPRQPMARMP